MVVCILSRIATGWLSKHAAATATPQHDHVWWGVSGLGDAVWLGGCSGVPVQLGLYGMVWRDGARARRLGHLSSSEVATSLSWRCMQYYSSRLVVRAGS